MGVVERAERKGRMRAMIFYALALSLMALLLIDTGQPPMDSQHGFLHGLWIGLSIAGLMNLAPLAVWLKPNNPIVRLLDEETTREHRRTSSANGFWAAVTAALALVLVTEGGAAIIGADVGRIIATAGVVAALVSFATLELRASR